MDKWYEVALSRLKETNGKITMTQEEKQLLLQDLCARLSYGVYISPVDCGKAILIGIKDGNPLLWDTIHNKEYDKSWNIEYIKPYLRPMSSMTEEEKNALNKRFYNIGYFFTQEPPYDYGLMVQHSDIGSIVVSEFSEVYDWLNTHHFDYRGLIEKGLALEAPEGMYKA